MSGPVSVTINVEAHRIVIDSNLELPEPKGALFGGQCRYVSPSCVEVYYPPMGAYYTTVEEARRWLLAIAHHAKTEISLSIK